MILQKMLNVQKIEQSRIYWYVPTYQIIINIIYRFELPILENKLGYFVKFVY